VVGFLRGAAGYLGKEFGGSRIFSEKGRRIFGGKYNIIVKDATAKDMEGSIEARAKSEISQDRRLAKGLVKGKVRAWENFYALYAEPLYRFAVTRLDGDGEGAGEVAQSVMATAVEVIRRFDAKKGSLWSWLRGIALNKLREALRDAARLAKLQEQMRESAGGEGDGESEVGNVPDVKLALSVLSPGHQEVLIRKYVDGQSVKDMAKAMRLSEKAVESRLTRGREAFRWEYSKLLKGKEAGPNG
jgi:RNA polymerase sigma-70 factor (ECF subfamily)